MSREASSLTNPAPSVASQAHRVSPQAPPQSRRDIWQYRNRLSALHADERLYTYEQILEIMKEEFPFLELTISKIKRDFKEFRLRRVNKPAHRTSFTDINTPQESPSGSGEYIHQGFGVDEPPSDFQFGANMVHNLAQNDFGMSEFQTHDPQDEAGIYQFPVSAAMGPFAALSDVPQQNPWDVMESLSPVLNCPLAYDIAPGEEQEGQAAHFNRSLDSR